MKSYSETSDLFTGEEQRLLRRATRLVEGVDDPRGELRCHELARAVGMVLGLAVQDGSYGFVDHTWLWTRPLPDVLTGENLVLGMTNILDVYAVGQLPMVRLVACAQSCLPHVGWAYRPGLPRMDVDAKIVDHLVVSMYRKFPAGAPLD